MENTRALPLVRWSEPVTIEAVDESARNELLAWVPGTTVRLTHAVGQEGQGAILGGRKGREWWARKEAERMARLRGAS